MQCGTTISPVIVDLGGDNNPNVPPGEFTKWRISLESGGRRAHGARALGAAIKGHKKLF